MNHLIILIGSLIRDTAIFAIPPTQQQHGHKQLNTVPRTQMTAPTTDKTKATKAKGNPSKKPNGLQSPILPRFFFSDPTLRLLRLCRFVHRCITTFKV